MQSPIDGSQAPAPTTEPTESSNERGRELVAHASPRRGNLAHDTPMIGVVARRVGRAVNLGILGYLARPVPLPDPLYDTCHARSPHHDQARLPHPQLEPVQRRPGPAR